MCPLVVGAARCVRVYQQLWILGEIWRVSGGSIGVRVVVVTLVIIRREEELCDGQAPTQMSFVFRRDNWEPVRVSHHLTCPCYTLRMPLGGLDIRVLYILIVLTYPISVEARLHLSEASRTNSWYLL